MRQVLNAFAVVELMSTSVCLWKWVVDASSGEIIGIFI